jgi:hypothetical protein
MRITSGQQNKAAEPGAGGQIKLAFNETERAHPAAIFASALISA